MEEALQHETTTQRIGLSPASPGNHPSDGPKTGDALTFKMDNSSGADQAVEEILQSLHGGAALGLLEDARDGQHRIPIKPGLREHGNGDLLLAAGELVPPAVHDQHAA